MYKIFLQWIYLKAQNTSVVHISIFCISSTVFSSWANNRLLLDIHKRIKPYPCKQSSNIPPDITKAVQSFFIFNMYIGDIELDLEIIRIEKKNKYLKQIIKWNHVYYSFIFILLNNRIRLKKKRKKPSVALSLCESVFFYENKF